MAIGLVGQVFLDQANLLRAGSGALLILFGAVSLRLLPVKLASSCRGPFSFLLRSPAADRPAAMGASYAVYCAGCCGPYLYGMALLAGAVGSWWKSAAVVLAFALVMAVPLLLPALSYRAGRKLSDHLQRWAPSLTRASGLALLVLGSLMVMELPVLLATSSR